MSPTSEQLEAAIAEAHRHAEVAARARAALDAEGFATDRLQIAVSNDVIVVVCADLDDGTRDRVVAALAGERDLAGYRIRVDDGGPSGDDDSSGDAAVSMLLEVAPDGSAAAAYSTGQRCHDTGDLVGAERWWRRAAQHGNEDALQAYRILMREQDRREESAQLFARLSAAGMTAATHQLGVCRFEQGQFEQAETSFELAADAGHAHSATACGVMWLRAGELQRARPWLERAVQLGDPDAENLLTLME
jgi:TPR repeat protein